MKKNKKEKKLSENFYKYRDMCRFFNFSNDDTFHIYVYVADKQDEEEIDKMLGEIYQYGLFRAKRGGVTPSHFVKFVSFLKRINKGERYQYLPIKRVVQYKGQSNDELYENEYYWLNAVYGYDEDVYLIPNEKNERKEYPAEWFIDVVPTKVRFDGMEKPEDNSEGFEVGKTYNVKKIKFLEYICENDKVCKCYEVFPLEFKAAKKEKRKKLKFDDALLAVEKAIEFGDVRRLSKIVNDDTEYISCNKPKPIKGRKNILDALENQRKYIYEKDCINVCNVMQATEDCEKSESKKGDKFLLIDYIDLKEMGTVSDPVFIECDDYFITKILIKSDYPASKYVNNYIVKELKK